MCFNNSPRQYFARWLMKAARHAQQSCVRPNWMGILAGSSFTFPGLHLRDSIASFVRFHLCGLPQVYARSITRWDIQLRRWFSLTPIRRFELLTIWSFWSCLRAASMYVSVIKRTGDAAISLIHRLRKIRRRVAVDVHRSVESNESVCCSFFKVQVFTRILK